jgi:hypothetical protein
MYGDEKHSQLGFAELKTLAADAISQPLYRTISIAWI